MHGTVLQVRGGDRHRNRDKDKERQTDIQTEQPPTGRDTDGETEMGGGGGRVKSCIKASKYTNRTWECVFHWHSYILCQTFALIKSLGWLMRWAWCRHYPPV